MGFEKKNIALHAFKKHEYMVDQVPEKESDYNLL